MSEQTSSKSAVSFRPSRKSFRNTDDVIETVITIPPDGGWGWVVVAASFFCNFVVDGTMYTFGLFLEDIAKTFDVHQTTIALASSIMTGFYYCFGCIACALVNRFGFRVIGSLGGIISALTFIIAAQIPSAMAFIIFLGMFGGIGFGMVYVPSIVAIGFYFERWRSLATSIAVTGSAMGIVLFPIIFAVLDKHTWQIKFMVIGGALFAVALVSVAYRPLKVVHVLKAADNQIIQYLEDEDSINSEEEESKQKGFVKKLFTRFQTNKKYPTAADVTDTTTIKFDQQENSSYSYSGGSYSSSSMVDSTILKTDQMDTHKSMLSTVYEYERPSTNQCCGKLCHRKCCVWCGFQRELVSRPMYRDDILYGGSLAVLPQYSRSMAAPSVMSRTSRKTMGYAMEYHMSVSRVATQRDLQNKSGTCCPESITRTLATMLDFNLLKSPSFFLLSFSGFLTYLGMYTPFIYLLERAATNFNINREEVSFAFSVLGIANALGRVLNGILSSMPWTNALIVSYVNILICGFATIISCVLTTKFGQFLYAVFYGFTVATVASLRSPIVVDLMGIENLTNAFGIILLFEGIAGFMGVPISSQFMKAFDHFNASFYFAGMCILLSGILLIPINRVAEWEKKRREAKENQH